MSSTNLPTSSAEGFAQGWFLAKLKTGGFSTASLHLKRQGFSTFMDLSRNCAAPLAAYYVQKENDYLTTTGDSLQNTDSGKESYAEF
jgi:hypothetical protein